MLYISLGWNCSPAIMRKNMFYQSKESGYNTQPFDLCVTPYSSLCECISEDFSNFFDLRLEDGIIMNYYNMWFNHESPTEFYANDNFKEFKNRYSNRINNFRKYLNGDNEICFIHSNPYEDSLKLCDIISHKYPNLIFKILAIQYADIDVYKNHFSDKSDCKTHGKMGKLMNFDYKKQIVSIDKIFYIEDDNKLYFFKDFNIYKNKYGKYLTPIGLDKGIDWVLRNEFIHEDETLTFISNIIKNGSIITAGTHIGTFLPFYSKISNKVYGFEPEPENFRFSIANILFNNLKNVEMQNIALGDKNTELFLKNKNLVEKSLCSIRNINSMDCIKINCKTLDSVFTNDKVYDISVIQLDVEEYEEHVLNGAINLITKYKPVIIYEKWGKLDICLPNCLQKLGYVCLNRKINENQVAYLPSIHNI